VRLVRLCRKFLGTVAWLIPPAVLFFALMWQMNASLPDHPDNRGEPEETAVLSAVGDIMLQNNLKSFAESSGGYGVLFKDVAPILGRSDIVFGNLESPVAPKSGRPQVSFVFNLDPSALKALRNAGFTVVSVANNHLQDQGANGVVETLENLTHSGLAFVGVKTEAGSPPRIDFLARGMKFSVLAYTILTNHGIQGDRYPRVALWNSENSLREIASARDDNDFVIVSMHWGEEYSVSPNQYQEDLAQAICDAGADVVLGHHPHTLQPIRWLTAGDRRCLVAFSLGNFVSNMTANYTEQMAPADGDPRDSIILQIVFRRTASPVPSIVPLWMVNSPTYKGVVPLETLCRSNFARIKTPDRFASGFLLARTRYARISSIIREENAGLSPMQTCVAAVLSG